MLFLQLSFHFVLTFLLFLFVSFLFFSSLSSTREGFITFLYLLRPHETRSGRFASIKAQKSSVLCCSTGRGPLNRLTGHFSPCKIQSAVLWSPTHRFLTSDLIYRTMQSGISNGMVVHTDASRWFRGSPQPPPPSAFLCCRSRLLGRSSLFIIPMASSNQVLAVGDPNPAPSNAAVPPKQPVTRKRKTVFDQLSALSSEETDAILWSSFEKSLVEKDFMSSTKRKRLEKMEFEWSNYIKWAKIPVEDTYLDQTFIKHARNFLHVQVKLTRVMRDSDEADQLVTFGTLEQWITTLIETIGRHCHDNQGKRNAREILRSKGTDYSKGLFQELTNEGKAIFEEYKLERRRTNEGRNWDLNDARLICESALDTNTSKRVACQTAAETLMAFYTGLRAGAMGYSYPEFEDKGKYMKLGDVTLSRLPHGGFQVKVDAEHLKMQNNEHLRRILKFNLNSVQRIQNLPIDFNSYLVASLFYEGRFPEHETLESLINGKEVEIKISDPELPLFRAARRGGWGLQPTKPASAHAINLAIVGAARRGGITDGSSKNFRRGVANQFTNLFGAQVAGLALGHADGSTMASSHYTRALEAYDVTAIRTGETVIGNVEMDKHDRMLNIFVGGALRARSYQLLNNSIPNNPSLHMKMRIRESDVQEDEEVEVDLENPLPMKKFAGMTSDLQNTKRNFAVDPEVSKAMDAEIKAFPDVQLLQTASSTAFANLQQHTRMNIHPRRWKVCLGMTETLDPADDPSTFPELFGQIEHKAHLAVLYTAANAALLKRKKALKKQRVTEYTRKSLTATAKLMQTGNIDTHNKALELQEIPSRTLLNIVPQNNNATSSSSSLPVVSSTGIPFAESSSGPAASTSSSDQSVTLTEVSPFAPDVSSEQPLILDDGEVDEFFCGTAEHDGEENGMIVALVKGALRKDRKDDIEDLVQTDYQDEFDENGEGCFNLEHEKRLMEVLEGMDINQARDSYLYFLVSLMETDSAIVSNICSLCPPPLEGEEPRRFNRSRLAAHIKSVHEKEPTVTELIRDEIRNRCRQDDGFVCAFCQGTKPSKDIDSIIQHWLRPRSCPGRSDIPDEWQGYLKTRQLKSGKRKRSSGKGKAKAVESDADASDDDDEDVQEQPKRRRLLKGKGKRVILSDSEEDQEENDAVEGSSSKAILPHPSPSRRLTRNRKRINYGASDVET